MKNVPLFEVLPPKTPWLNRLAAHRDEARQVGEFFEWLMAHYGDAEMSGLPPVDTLLHEFFEIDAKECENERRKLLAYQRVLNTIVAEKSELKSLGIISDDA